MEIEVSCIAFQVIGGSNSRPIVKVLISEYCHAMDGDPAKQVYRFLVGPVPQYDFLPDFDNTDSDDLIFYFCTRDYELALGMFNDCNDVTTAKRWQLDDAEVYGERRLFERAQK